jgi:hypothetical protein
MKNLSSSFFTIAGQSGTEQSGFNSNQYKLKALWFWCREMLGHV